MLRRLSRSALVLALALLCDWAPGVPPHPVPTAAAQQQIVLPGGTLVQIYSQTLGPTAITRTNAVVSSGVLAGVQQTFTVTGLQTTDKVFVNGPAVTKACPFTGAADVSAVNTLRLTFAYLTGATCTPATGTYSIWTLRSTP